MKVTEQTVLKMTVSQIKSHNEGYFFSRNTMKFFGDKMTSFGVKTFEGKRVLYRKPSAMVNTPFSGWRKAGKEFMGVWIIQPKNESLVDIMPTSEDFKQRFINSIF